MCRNIDLLMTDVLSHPQAMLIHFFFSEYTFWKHFTVLCKGFLYLIGKGRYCIGKYCRHCLELVRVIHAISALYIFPCKDHQKLLKPAVSWRTKLPAKAFGCNGTLAQLTRNPLADIFLCIFGNTAAYEKGVRNTRDSVLFLIYKLRMKRRSISELAWQLTEIVNCEVLDM